MKHKIKGLTLIEALIWFAIFAAVVAGVFALYSNSRNQNNAETVNKELATIFSQTEMLFSDTSTAVLDEDIGLQLGIFPKSLKVSGTAIKNVFGGKVAIDGVPPSGYTVTYTNIPSGEVCSSIVRTQRSVGWNVGANISYDSTYDLSKVATACGNNGGPPLTLAFKRTN